MHNSTSHTKQVERLDITNMELHSLPRSPPLRRQVAVGAATIDDTMMKISNDYTSSSNADILKATNLLRRGKFTHPRARQMAAAARYGWRFTNDDVFRPEDWMESLSVTWNRERYSLEK